MDAPHCTHCGHAVSLAALFCEQCGASLRQRACAACGADLSPSARFCSACGTDVGSSPKEPPALNQLDFFASPLNVEQRQATVINCDLVDFTALTTSLDPEDSRRVLAEALDAIRNTVYRFKRREDDLFDRTEGDSVMFCFGLPRASEQDAEQAVRAALEAVQAVKRIRALPWLVVNVRIGVATGQVVVDANSGTHGQKEALISGPAPNLAGRLRAYAQPGGVVISDATHRLVAESFKCRDLGEIALKGLHPEHAWEVSGARRGTQALWPHGAVTALTPLIGREQEIGVLMHCWELARAGVGQTVIVAGEAGVGKSRLVAELQVRLKKQQVSQQYFKCGQQYANSAFHPIAEFLHRQIGRVVNERGLSASRRTAKYIEACGLPSTDLPYIADVVSAGGLSESYETMTLSDQSKIELQQHRRETIRSLVSLLQVTLARQGPSIVVFEDAHWSDPSSVEVMEEITKRIVEWPCLLIVTLRPEQGEVQWRGEAITPLELSRLSRSESARMVRSVPKGQTIPPPILNHIVEKADGVPLFLEELTKDMVDSLEEFSSVDPVELDTGAAPVPIPVTLRDLLTARLDRSHRAKFVAQVGSIIGREFSTSALTTVAQVSTVDIERGLSDLREAGLLYTRETPRGMIHAFKHALVQDVARESLIRSHRRQLHERFAHLLEEGGEGTRERQPEVVAYHFFEAANYEKAVRYWTEGGELAASRSANREAIHQFKRALEALKLSSPSAQRNQTELRLHCALAQVLAITQGYASEEVALAFEHARSLFPAVHESADKFSVLWREGDMFLFRAQYHLGLQRGKELAQTAIESGNPEYLAHAHLLIGLAYVYLGRFELSREHLQKALDVNESEEPPLVRAARYGELPVRALGYLSRPLWFLGLPDQALEKCRASIALAEKVSIPLSTTQACGMRMLLHAVRSEPVQLKEWIDITLSTANEHNQVYWIRLATILDCWRRVREGGGERALKGLEIGIANYESTKSQVGLSVFLGLMADALTYVGRYDEALKLIDRSVAFCQETGEEYFLSEMHRGRGHVLIAQSKGKAVIDTENAYKKSLEVARRQKALSLELRTGLDLANLWRDASRSEEASALLQGICSRFSEGFNSTDFVAAKALLAELEVGRAGQLVQ